MILVTGGTGFVGSHLLYRLTKNGNKVKAIKRHNSSTQLVERVFNWHKGNINLSNIDWIEADVLDTYSLLDAFEDIDQVYHTAALVSFDPKDKNLMMRTNAEGTANVVNAALEKKVSKLCYVSSIAALGRATVGKFIDEKTHFSSSTNPSNYSISKFEAEREVWRGIEEGLNAVIINPSVILGPGNWDRGSSKLFKTVQKGLKFYTKGSNGFVDVNDVVESMIMLMESKIKNDRFLITAENVYYKQLFTWMAEALGVPAPKYKAGSLMSAAYWRASKAISMITGRKPIVTKESARTAQQIYYYDNSKFVKQFDFKYIPVKQSIFKTAMFFNKF